MLDHVWGWSQFGGALLAAVALVIALVSARHSKRSAEAADNSAKAAGRTAESAAEIASLAQEQMSRRPVLGLTVESINPYEWEESKLTPARSLLGWTNSVGIQLGLANTGSADADETVINVIVPPGARVWKWRSASGEGETAMVIHRTGQEFEEFPHAVYAIDEVDVRRGIATVTFYRLEFEDVGTYPIRVSATHPDSTVSVSRTVEAS